MSVLKKVVTEEMKKLVPISEKEPKPKESKPSGVHHKRSRKRKRPNGKERVIFKF